MGFETPKAPKKPKKLQKKMTFGRKKEEKHSQN